MEPITFATAFASIVGLLGVYKNEVREREGRDFNAYLDWLQRREHGQLVDLIHGNDELSRSLRVLVEDQHGEVMAKLAELDKTLCSVASHIAEFQPLADAIRAKSGLSDQAVSILRQLNEAEASRFLEIGLQEGNEYAFLDTHGQLQIDEPGFIYGDLDTLRELGLLLLSHNESGGRIFTITRAGAAVGG